MSESSASRTAPPRLPLAAAPHGSALFRSLTGLLARWLPRQRWYAGKGRPLGGLTLISATELLPCGAGAPTPGLLHLLIGAHPQGAPEEAQGVTGAGDCYQLLLGVRTVLPPNLATALVGRPAEGPLCGRAVYEALHDPRLTALLLERLRAPGRLGTLRFERAPEVAIAPGQVPRVLSAEQTNSSIVYGEAHILKLFRRVSPGVNPDLELPRAMAQAGCSRVPAPSAWFEAYLPPAAGAGGEPPGGGFTEPLTLGVLQPYLAGSSDGWQLACKALSLRTDFSSAAHAIGRATGEVHAALAAALPTTVLDGPELERTARGMNERLEAAAAAVPQLRPYRTGLRRAFDQLSAYGAGGGRCTAQRLHGDLHLGQVLHGGNGGSRWSIIDFEGEPARPIAERRRPQPPVRDIAGMLRSFDYAACQHRASGAWTAAWARASRAAYCRGYAEASGRDPLHQPELLRAYEIDKAIYEVLYEARHRPSWLHVPMAAIRRLAAAGPS
ncbi:maltokinase N-terminal cap-like domain-containing protein [Streptomyces aidingensis]|uniref:Maltokinase n=1 Tax=Streptomyces aidingensis TaxID=910347 RepID=A0A1I1T1J4_9ACTN|nr:phosphotransferase [Streptomyces aidingensis]SFD49150.1 maltokinase [Streptomyces aidingensis]